MLPFKDTENCLPVEIVLSTADLRFFSALVNMISRLFIISWFVLHSIRGYMSPLPLRSRIASSCGAISPCRFNDLHLSKLVLKSTTENDVDIFGTESRFVLSLVAFSGAAETAFLTYSKLTATSLGNFCSSPESCNNVLNGPYSTIPGVDIPLSALAFVGYFTIAALSAAPLIRKSLDTPQTRSVILFTSSGMAAFSIYLMVLLAAVIKTPCNFCYLSAVLSFTMAGIALSQKAVRNPTNSFVISASSASLSFVTSIFLFYSTSTLVNNAAVADSQSIASINSASAASTPLPADKKPAEEAPKIKNNSTPRAILIGERLHALNAKMFGAFWCSHCNNQKQELGIEASKMFEYVECAKDGSKSQYAFCKEQKIPGFPTWQINGELYPGEKDLSELERLLTDVEKKVASASVALN